MHLGGCTITLDTKHLIAFDGYRLSSSASAWTMRFYWVACHLRPLSAAAFTCACAGAAQPEEEDIRGAGPGTDHRQRRAGPVRGHPLHDHCRARHLHRRQCHRQMRRPLRLGMATPAGTDGGAEGRPAAAHTLPLQGPHGGSAGFMVVSCYTAPSVPTLDSEVCDDAAAG